MSDLKKLIKTTIREFLNENINELNPSVVNVMGKSFTWNELNGGKLYHGSRTDLDVGDILTSQKNRNFKQSDNNKVSITSDYNRAKHWASQIKSDNPIYIYEIEPMGEIEIWRVSLAKQGTMFDLWEGRVNNAKIINKYIL